MSSPKSMPEDDALETFQAVSEHMFRRSMRLQRHRQFILEALMVIAFGGLVWLGIRFVNYGSGLGYAMRFPPFWFPVFIFVPIALIFLLMVYYGTSFEITPLRLLLPWLGRFSRLEILGLKLQTKKGKVLPNEESRRRAAELAAAQSSDELDSLLEGSTKRLVLDESSTDEATRVLYFSARDAPQN